MKYYSQHGQDEYVYTKIFESNKSTGFFVDIGAYDGISQGSNSLFFENMGWEGVCIEPNPYLYKELIKNRRCKCYNFAMSNKMGEEDFLCIERGGLDTLGGLISSYYYEQGVKDLMSTNNHSIIKVKTNTFDNIIESQKIDYLSIDTEGNEYKILSSIDFDKYDIHVISVEINNNGGKIYDLLTSLSYKLDTTLGCDQIFIKEYNR